MVEDLYIGTFENGLPFFSNEFTFLDDGSRINSVKLNLDHVYNRLAIRKPSLIIIDGASGDGKTTLATEISDYFNAKIGKPPINFCGNQYAKGGEDFTKKLKKAYEEGHNNIIYDEGGDLNRKTTLSRFNRTMDMVFNQLRIYDMVIILITQSVGYLENDLFTKGIVRILFNCYGRKDLISSNFRLYELDRINYLRFTIKKEITPTKAYDKIVANNYGKFFNLSKVRDEELHLVGKKKKDEDISKGDLRLDGLVNYKDISDKLGLSESYVAIRLNKLRVKPVKFFKRRAYFNRGVIDLLKK